MTNGQAGFVRWGWIMVALLLALGLLGIGGCSPGGVIGPRETPTPTETPIPTETPGPTPTPDPVQPDDIVYVRRFVFGEHRLPGKLAGTLERRNGGAGPDSLEVRLAVRRAPWSPSRLLHRGLLGLAGHRR